MPVRTDHLVLYHIPKCGGIWAKEALRRSLRDKSAYARCNSSGVVNPFGLYREHATPDGTLEEDKLGRLSVCFVRHPVTWYQSFWAFRIKSESYDPDFPLDDLMDESIDRFVQNVFSNFPNGFVTELYRYFVGEDLSKINFIGKQETLSSDLVEVMKLAGEDFDEDVVKNLKWINVSGHSKRYKSKIKISPAIESQILEKEDWVIQTFYKNNV